jgi:replication factor C subunit 3/5
MFLIGKYAPTDPVHFEFNQDVFSELRHMSFYEDIPHIIISGPRGGGKKTLLRFFLRELFDDTVEHTKKITYQISGSSKKNVEIMQSNYHICIEPNNNNHDKYVLQEIIKKYTMYRQFNINPAARKFKVIVIYNLENLSPSSQAALRRTMERYAKTCRFIMICNNLSKISDPLRSRSKVFCVSMPSTETISYVIQKICLHESIKMSKPYLQKILDYADGNLKKAMWYINMEQFGASTSSGLDESFHTLLELILSVGKGQHVIDIFNLIRTNIYTMLITNIKASDIIIQLLEMIIKRVPDNKFCLEVINFASEAEFNLIHGRRDIVHIDYFVSEVMRSFVKYCRQELKTANGHHTVKKISSK